MLTISKPAIFGPDGLAARGQCNHDSPGWQLRWVDSSTPPVMIWQGAFKTCRHLQSTCASATTLDQAQKMVGELFSTASFTHFASQPTDAYPSPTRLEKGSREDANACTRRKRKKKKH